MIRKISQSSAIIRKHPQKFAKFAEIRGIRKIRKHSQRFAKLRKNPQKIAKSRNDLQKFATTHNDSKKIAKFTKFAKIAMIRTDSQWFAKKIAMILTIRKNPQEFRKNRNGSQ